MCSHHAPCLLKCASSGLNLQTWFRGRSGSRIVELDGLLIWVHSFSLSSCTKDTTTERNCWLGSGCWLTNYLAHLCANYLAHKEGSGQPLIRLAR
jgi:hypothetical protein